MSGNRLALPLAGGVAALGGYFLYKRSPSSAPIESKSVPQQRREVNDAKREAGLGGAGVGQNAQTGLHEHGAPGSGQPTSNTHPDRAVKTDAPKEMLPSGGVGGGVGAGGANVRAVDVTAKKPTTEGQSGGGTTTTTNTTTTTPSKSQMLQGAFGTGGAAAGEQKSEENKRKWHDTRIHSHEGSELPTKKAAPN